MNHLENKTLMILVMIVLIVSSSLFAGVSKLNRMADDIHQEFLVGEKKDGLSIQHDLDTRIECARNIVTLAKKYGIETTRANAAVQVFEQADSIHEKFICNQSLGVEIQSLVQQLQDASLTTTNAKNLKEQVSIFENAQNTISLDPYNTLVAEYEKETSGLIGNVLKIFAKDVEYFR
ncbi:MAG: hypothetical protein IJO78_06315 [Erysipelotrichaceae bacterium]|nr:hypothetical protein [Erysipelotrichaceae bacterium]MBQ9841188.1 hypothetical protein [Erysipelotrichaceae bacterium]